MAEVIVIDDSPDEGEEENSLTETCRSPHLVKMECLTEKLKIHFSSRVDGGSDDECIAQWRMKLNPFRTYGFLYKSKYAFEDLKETSPLLCDIFSVPNDDVSDDVLNSSFNGDEIVNEEEKTVENDENNKISLVSDNNSSKIPSENNVFPQTSDGHTLVEEVTYDMELSQKVGDDEDVKHLGVNCNGEKMNKPVGNINTLSDFQNENKDYIHNKKIILNDGNNDILVPVGLSNQAEEENDQKCSVLQVNLLTDEKGPSNKSDDPVDLDLSNLPYYLKNFMDILMTVLNSDNKRLFNENEIKSLQKFKHVSDTAKKLYIRLYQRKRDWFRCDKIQYPRIADDLASSFKELVDFNYLYDENSLVDFDDICNLLTAPETRSLADNIKLKVNNTKNNSKADLVRLLKEHCQKQRTIFMTKNNSMRSILSKNAKKYIGKCVKLKEEERFLFTRVILLFCLTTSHLADTTHNNSHGTTILYQMLLSNLGNVKYPSFKLNKQNEIFLTREQLIDYAHAVELENDFEFLVEKKDYSAAMKCYNKIRSQLVEVLEEFLSLGNNMHCLQLPSFLSCFSKEWVTIRLANKCVDILEKERNYSEAVILIELLLSQKFLRSSSRGFLWERLILDYERYIKNFDKAYLCSVEALKDPYLRTGHRYDVLQRNKRLDKSTKVQARIKDKSMKSYREEIIEPKEETIQSKIFLESSANNRAVFLSSAAGDDYSLSNVEQHVITHYESLGFPSGRHGEGSSVTTLFYLLFWDIIFMDIEDVFQSEFQNSPLDMFYDKFYLNREDKLNERLNVVYHASDEYLRVSISNTWKQNYGTHSVGVNWGLFEDEFEAGDLAVCIGRKVLGGICELFCKDFRRRKGGFPDLIVWNADKKTCKIIEVKGPGDKLSVKQIVWLDVLTYLGADAFACFVTGVGGKRKRKSAD